MGPLAGITVVEFAAIGPVPFCAQLLGTLGADVILVDRPEAGAERLISARNRRSIAIDLKHPDGVEVALRLVVLADVALEGHRPGVMERLGIGPDVCLDLNPGLVYGRMTGWGQDGPMSQMAGHDINYISMVGALDAIGPEEQPVPPLNLVGDYGGGAMFLAMGVLAAIVERATSGQGQVVDAAMVDGAATLMDPFFTLAAVGRHREGRASNMLDGGAPFYTTYRTADHRFVAVGAIEPQFYAALLRGLDLADAPLPDQWDTDRWGELRGAIGAVFATRARDHWSDHFLGTDACVTPVLTMTESVDAPHNVARGVFSEVGGVAVPDPAPRFSRSGHADGWPGGPVGGDTESILRSLGYTEPDRMRLRTGGWVR